MASYNFKSGILSKNEESLDKEIELEKQSQNNAEKEQNIKTEILKVDLEKVKVEKHQLEGQLAYKSEELDDLKQKFINLNEEKEEIRKTLEKECMDKIKIEKDNNKLTELNNELNTKFEMEQSMVSNLYKFSLAVLPRKDSSVCHLGAL